MSRDKQTLEKPVDESTEFIDLLLNDYRAKALVFLYSRIDSININAIEERIGISALHFATYNRNINLIIALMLIQRQSLDLNIADYDGLTPLMYAVDDGQLEIVQLLIDNGAQATIRDNKGRNSLDIANIHKDEKITQIIMKAIDAEEKSMADTKPEATISAEENCKIKNTSNITEDNDEKTTYPVADLDITGSTFPHDQFLAGYNHK